MYCWYQYFTALFFFVVCEDCHAPYHGDCPVHGPLIPLDESRGWDQDSKSFTSVPVPLQVTVKMSSIMNAGKGVFAKEFIPRRTRIGPYKGEVVQKEDITDKTDTSYFWEVSYTMNSMCLHMPLYTLLGQSDNCYSTTLLTGTLGVLYLYTCIKTQGSALCGRTRWCTIRMH